MTYKTRTGHYVRVERLADGSVEFVTTGPDRNVISSVTLPSASAVKLLAHLRVGGGRA